MSDERATCWICDRPIRRTVTGWVHVNLTAWADDPHEATPEPPGQMHFTVGLDE